MAVNLGAKDCSIPCNLCGGTEVSILSTRSRSGNPLRTVICQACGLVWSDPRPHDARQFYEAEYRLAYKNTYSPKPKHVVRAGKVALSRFGKIAQLLSSQKTVLDVGTGGGEFAYLLQSLGHVVNGIEPNRGYADHSIQQYGLTVRVGFVQDATFDPASFDIVTIWHVLEHTEDPGFILARLRSWLKPDGVLVVEVPNVEATCQAPRNTFHEAHLYNFNVVSLRRLAKSRGCTKPRISSPRMVGISRCFYSSRAPDHRPILRRDPWELRVDLENRAPTHVFAASPQSLPICASVATSLSVARRATRNSSSEQR